MKILLLLITPDRGLAGPLVSNLYKEAGEFITPFIIESGNREKLLQLLREDANIIPVEGEDGSTTFRRREIKAKTSKCLLMQQKLLMQEY